MVSLVFFHHFFDGSCFQKVSGLFLENAIKKIVQIFLSKL